MRILLLGSQITSSLSRKDNVGKRCRSALILSQQLVDFIKHNRITKYTVIIIYNTVIFPMMTYSLKVTTLTRANRQKLRRYEKRCLSILLKYSRFRKQGPKKVNELLHGKTVTRRIKVMRLSYWGHVKRRPQHHMLKLADTYSCQKKKKVGRPSFTNKDSMKDTFVKYGLSIQQWNELANDKTKLKSAAESIYNDMLNDTSSEDDQVISDSDTSSSEDFLGFSEDNDIDGVSDVD